MKKAPHNRAAQPGYGLMLILAFFMMLVMTAVSLQATNGTPAMMMAKRSVEYISASNIAKTGLAAIRADIYNKLQAGNSVDTSYTYASTNISVPGDPSAIGTINSVVGSYSGSVKYAGIDTFLVQATGVAGNASVTATELMTISGFSCSAVETQILAGNIASVSDNQLIQYARNNCMLKKAASIPTIATVPASSSSTDCSSGTPAISNGTGTIEYRNVTGTCLYNMNVSGQAYSTVRFALIRGNTVAYGHASSAYTGAREIDVTTFDGGAVNASGLSGGVTLKFNTISKNAGVTDAPRFGTGSGDDFVSVNGNIDYTYGFDARGGNDTMIIGGNYGMMTISSGSDFSMNSGDDKFFVQTMNSTATASTDIPFVKLGLGNDEMYFDGANGNSNFSPKIYGGDATGGTTDGDDIISCVGTQLAGCTIGTQPPDIYGEGGNDIIDIDAAIASNVAITRWIHGGTGNNIIYLKGKTGSMELNICASSNDYPTGCTTSTSSGNSVVIIGGDYTGGSTNAIMATGSNNVLLYKSGANVSVTKTGFARTLAY